MYKLSLEFENKVFLWDDGIVEGPVLEMLSIIGNAMYEKNVKSHICEIIVLVKGLVMRRGW